MENEFQLNQNLLDYLKLLNCSYTNKTIKDELTKKFKNNRNNVILTNEFKQILGISSEIKTINIDTLISIIKMNHSISLFKPKCTYLEYNQKPEYVNSI